jgi:hypothetical protein
MDVVECGRLNDNQRAELEGDEDDPFDAAGDTLRWRSKDRHVALRGPDGRLIAEMPYVSMWRPLGEGWELPAGQLVLHSLPF